MKRFGVFVLGLALSLPASACIQGFFLPYHEERPQAYQLAELDEQSSQLSFMPPGLLAPTPAELKNLAAYEKAHPRPQTYQEKTDHAVLLVHAGQAPRALALLQEAEKQSPGHYEIAADLGTAFELSGDNEQALKWIKEGIKRKPDSHQGSEWLHVKILEAKIAMKRDPKWLESNFVSGVDVGQHGESIELKSSLPRGNRGQLLTLAEYQDHLFYQLHERLQFLSPKDPIVRELMIEYGSVHFLRDPDSKPWVWPFLGNLTNYADDLNESKFILAKSKWLLDRSMDPLERRVTPREVVWNSLIVSVVPLLFMLLHRRFIRVAPTSIARRASEDVPWALAAAIAIPAMIGVPIYVAAVPHPAAAGWYPVAALMLVCLWKTLCSFSWIMRIVILLTGSFFFMLSHLAIMAEGVGVTVFMIFSLPAWLMIARKVKRSPLLPAAPAPLVPAPLPDGPSSG